jgi:Flp pilus assembly protein TadD
MLATSGHRSSSVTRYNVAAYANAADVCLPCEGRQQRCRGDAAPGARAGRAKEAVTTLEAARKRVPYDGEVVTALAHFALEAGNRDAARAYVRELRELEPDEPAHARLAAQIEGEAGGR